MSDFVSKELKTIDLGDGKFVKVPKEVSFGDVQKISKLDKEGKDASLMTLLMFIREWNLSDEEGIAPINEGNINRMKIDHVKKINDEIAKMIEDDKKKEAEESQH